MKKNHTKITEKKENKETHILVFRFSSMGDVALTAPVLKGILENNPAMHITLVTRTLYRPIFEGMPRLKLFLCDFHGRYNGLYGLIRLFFDLKSSDKYDYVIDLHSVLRTWILDGLFRMSGKHVEVLDKGRKEKEQLVKGRIFRKLKSTSQRYIDTFSRINIFWNAPSFPVIQPQKEYIYEADEFLRTKDPESKIRVGIAPFALHKLKTWPEEHTKGLLKMLEERTEATVFLFGGGREEEIRLADMAGNFNRCISMAGQISLGAEIALMQKMQFMLTMDSANMHLAALSGVKTVTLWGATHPWAGFEAFQQEDERNIQIPKNELPCRPCTVFGKGECHRGDFACMQWLTPELVFNRLINLGFLESSGITKAEK